MRSLHPSQPQLLQVHLLLCHLCLLARLLGIAFDPEAQQQGEPRPKPGQPVIRPSRLCLFIGGSAVLHQVFHLLQDDLSKFTPLQLTRTAVGFDSEQEGWLQAHLLTDGWGRRSAT